MSTQQEQFKKYVDDIVHVNYTDWDSIFTLKNAIYQFQGFLETNIEGIESHDIYIEREIQKLSDSIDKLEYYGKAKPSDLSKMLIVKSEVLKQIDEIEILLKKETHIRYKPIQ